MRIVFETDDPSVRSADPEEGGEVAAMEHRPPSGREVLGEAVAGLLGDLLTRVVYLDNPVTHKIVCRCSCTTSSNGGIWQQDQTFDERADCRTLNDVNCNMSTGKAGKLYGCEKTSVKVSARAVQDEPLLVKSES